MCFLHLQENDFDLLVGNDPVETGTDGSEHESYGIELDLDSSVSARHIVLYRIACCFWFELIWFSYFSFQVINHLRVLFAYNRFYSLDVLLLRVFHDLSQVS